MSVPGSVRGAVAAARLGVLALAGLVVAGLPAAADTTTFNGVDAPIVRIFVRQGDVTIRTWNRKTVQIDGDPALAVERRSIDQSGDPLEVPIQPARQDDSPDALELPPETFVAGAIPAGLRDVVSVQDAQERDPATPAGVVVVTIPGNAVYVSATAVHGNLEVHDYRAGTLVASVGSGRLTLAAVGGVVFAQSRRGPIVIRDSTFDRIRARSLLGDITFERCRVRQIVATTGAGSIAYDGGSFEPGLALFESERGDIAIGADGPVQFGAHAATDGHVFTDLGRGAHVDGEPPSGAQATIGNGGPVVTATTRSGNVYLYHGSLRKRHGVSGQWRAPLKTLQRPGRATRRPMPGGLPHFGGAPRSFMLRPTYARPPAGRRR
jgi:hypothetical protein